MKSLNKSDYVLTPDGWYGYIEEIHAKGKTCHVVHIGYETTAPRSKTFPAKKLTGPFSREEVWKKIAPAPKAA